MNSILNAIKCAHCHEILKSPVILPCNCNICNKHVSNQSNDGIRCEKCGVEHQIPTNGFHPNNALQEIIETKIANLNFGSVHKEAKESCESFGEYLREFEVLLKDPYAFTHERISELKNSVQLKGEELKLIIDQEIKKLFDRLEEYEKQSKENLSSNEFKEESKKLKNEIKLAQSKLDLWLESLNEIKFDEGEWKRIKEESNQKLKKINEESEKFKNKLILNRVDENQNEVNWFKTITIDSIFKYLSVGRGFLVSRIVNESSAQNLEELLKKKELNGRNWSLLYQGSRDGFLASDFHSRCDNKPNTLTIVKSTNGNIFGGFTSAQWKSSVTVSWEYDKNAFIFSLVNKENRPLLFEQTSSNRNSIGSFNKYGPIFGDGDGNDFVIFDCSNSNTYSYSNLGKAYVHPEYQFDSERAKKILAGTFHFEVLEIEVFQMQH